MARLFSERQRRLSIGRRRFVGIFFSLLILFLWGKKWGGGEKQTHTQIVQHQPPHTGHVQLWTLEGCSYLLFIDLLSTGSLSPSILEEKLRTPKFPLHGCLNAFVRLPVGLVSVCVCVGRGGPRCSQCPNISHFLFLWLPFWCVCVCVCKFLFLNLFLGIFQHAPLRLVPSPHTHTHTSVMEKVALQK